MVPNRALLSNPQGDLHFGFGSGLTDSAHPCHVCLPPDRAQNSDREKFAARNESAPMSVLHSTSNKAARARINAVCQFRPKCIAAKWRGPARRTRFKFYEVVSPEFSASAAAALVW